MLGIAVGAVSLAAHFGSWLWLLDLAANFRPQFAVVLLTCGALAVLDDPRVAVAVLLVGIVDTALVAPYLMGAGTDLAGGDHLEVMTFNVGVSNPNRAAVVEFIANEDPDVVFVFESSFEWEDALRSAGLALQILTVVPPGSVAGVTVLARPALRPGVVEVALGGEAAAVTIDLGERRIDLLGIHPLSPTSRRRSDRRDAMIAAAADWVRSRPGEVVVVGDMNASPWSHAMRSLRRDGALIDTMRGAGLQRTWPTGWGPLAIPIDHVLHTSGLASADRRTGPAFGSAHRPVLVTIGWSA